MEEFIIFSFLLAFSRSVEGVGQYRKCCKDGQALNSNRQCTSEGTGPSSILDLEERYQPDFELIGVGFPDCSYTEAFQFNISSKFTIWTDQGLQLAKYSKIFQASEYCLDFFEDQVLD
ncbi:uncharacterized protein LOC111699375 [Eurytemora carolleeae]|uniref:uncharacterized protein LOC111699375 n=1 Tax=Eurytemora carolleeae TaxID=1294199 RepID=UPI000C786B94|nr:uncharacterized protein LOC111699375 [Eurytemora carolleeae]|eukprot:XP_023325816.1 uncharacterized protein LOC111699375 [Eurytemora affinis]